MADGIYYAGRLREVFLSGTWIANTNYKLAVDGLTWADATRKIGSHNSIAELVYHINYYLQGLIPVLDGGPLEIKDKYSFDLPPIASEEEWQVLNAELLGHAEKFAGRVERMTAEEMAVSFVKAEYGTYERNIEAVIEHGYYHLGQIVLIRKLIEEKKKDTDL